MTTADATASGMPYSVIAVAGAQPHSVDQFIGENAFTISKGDMTSQVCGTGTPDQHGVRFHEKTSGADAKDVRVWEIRPTNGGFTAATVSSF